PRRNPCRRRRNARRRGSSLRPSNPAWIFLPWSLARSSNPGAPASRRQPRYAGRVMASLTVGGVLLLTMIAASARGAVRLARDARIPVHYGSVEHCLYVSKAVGLVIWPGAGAVLVGVVSAIPGSRLAGGWVPGVRERASARGAMRDARVPGRRF